MNEPADSNRASRRFLWCAWGLAAMLTVAALAAYYAQILGAASGGAMLLLVVTGPASLRAAAKLRGPGGASVLAAVLGSLGVATAATLASCITFCTVCTAGTLSLMQVAASVSHDSLDMLNDPMNVTIGLSAVAAAILFGGLLYGFWPREKTPPTLKQ